ncbi:hypothetical protein D4764_02G0012300 [Takifugu flavidus]|uniref:Uncharacterized protein n=1 Tax=Takifugu flavidus TaxID=433684 RepID=A0A5C6NNF6_9TELE|nr:hypothetical protein D4764_02G0012300 [Takifugu flavidus]
MFSVKTLTENVHHQMKTRVLYQRPGGLRVLRRILAVPRTVLFWTEISGVVPSICWSIYSAWPLVLLQLLLFLLPDVATSITTTVFWCLSTTTMSGWLATTILSVWIWKSHRILACLFSTTFGGVSHLVRGTSSPYSDVPVHYASHLVMPFHVCPACQHLAPCCDVLDCLRGISTQSAPGVWSGMVDPGLVW